MYRLRALASAFIGVYWTRVVGLGEVKPSLDFLGYTFREDRDRMAEARSV